MKAVFINKLEGSKSSDFDKSEDTAFKFTLKLTKKQRKSLDKMIEKRGFLGWSPKWSK